MIEQVKKYLIDLQQTICSEIELLDGGSVFEQDYWSRDDQRGNGVTCIISNGNVFEKGGVNFSIIRGDKMPKSASALRPELEGRQYTALGVSLVLHPDNPFIPTAHANVRFFVAEEQGKDPIWWFGGGFDLTPYYGFDEDAVHWHETAKKACIPFGEDVYPKYKQWCDDYFFLPHRNEPRGIGGLFFDDLNEGGFERCFGLMQAIGNSYVEAYRPIMAKKKEMPFGARERDFQLYRRGRYVEFNLVQDRGTIFGLQSNGRTESILMSLPPLVSWVYDWTPEEGSAEAALTEKFLIAKDWV